jgi:O-antigen/teichoic acid export membrane protein
MSEGRRTVYGAIWNWIALVCNFGVAFFLSPFVVHRLGATLYGVWALVIGLTSYMTLMDLGLRGAVVRFVSRYHDRGEHASSSLMVSGALWLRQWISVGVVLLSSILALLFTRFYHIPPEVQSAARLAVFLSGLSIAVTLYFGVFGGVLTGLQRFDLSSSVTLLQTAARAGAVVWVLRSGHGLLSLALCELSVALAANLLQMYLCFRAYPELRITLRYPEREILREFAGYSLWVFLIHIFAQIIYYTDNLVVGAIISVSAVTFYAIGGSLFEYLRNIVASLTMTFLPLASKYQASGDYQRLRELLLFGTRVAIGVALPVQIALFFRGQTFIDLWMGSQYGAISSRVLQILLVAQLFTIANSTSVNIVLGMAAHRRVAIWSGCEAIANLALSIFLGRKMGIYGVAVGTLIPSLFVQVILWPRYVSKLVQTTVSRYVLQAWVQPFLAGIPFGIACFLIDRYWLTQHLAVFFLQIILILPIYALTIFLFFGSDILRELRKRTSWFASSKEPLSVP